MLTKLQLTKKRAIIIVVITACVIAALILFLSAPERGPGDSLEGRVEFLSDLGWEVDPDTEISELIVFPEDFSEILNEYNKLQLAQGYDLRDYAGMECTRYSYSVLNYPNGDTNVLAQIFVYENTIIGGDIHSTALDGFMHGLK